MGYTTFGKIVRKLMIDNDETLCDVASFTSGTTAFVSAVLTGKKNVPDGWIDAISTHYHLSEKEREELYDAYCEQKSSVRIDIGQMNINGKKLAIMFQRKLPGLTDEEMDSIRAILGDSDDGV
ncbi:MAG: XRE family transcriptional regulator [Clostridia bacterium]|nr:XRE family transcriptional regulator [Clostridia bacterium]